MSDSRTELGYTLAPMTPGAPKPMSWVVRAGHHCSGYYQIYLETRGYSAWCKSKRTFGLLGREIATLAAAKALCQKHHDGR